MRGGGISDTKRDNHPGPGAKSQEPPRVSTPGAIKTRCSQGVIKINSSTNGNFSV